MRALLALTILVGAACARSAPATTPLAEPEQAQGADHWAQLLEPQRVWAAATVKPAPDTSEALAVANSELARARVAPSHPLPAPWAAAPARKADVSPPAVSAAAAVVVDEASGAVLFQRDAHKPLAPASLTKVATAILALERGGLDAQVAIDVDSREMRSSTVMGLLPGDVFTLRDLLYGLMLPSGNDAALAIARHLSGSDSAFVAEMNWLVARLGLVESRFANPHGLGGRNHAASAYDLAMLARYAMSLDGFRALVSAPAWTARGSRTIAMGNINSLLYSYRGADGVKTGYTRTAGQTLIGSAARDGHRLYVVVLNAPEREVDARKLLDWAFATFEWSASP